MRNPQSATERLSRQQAAERLTDMAYALTTGGELKVDDDPPWTVVIADEVVLKRGSRASGERVELALELSWSTADPAT